MIFVLSFEHDQSVLKLTFGQFLIDTFLFSGEA